MSLPSLLARALRTITLAALPLFTLAPAAQASPMLLSQALRHREALRRQAA